MSLAHAWSTPLAVALSFALATAVAPHQAHAKEGERETAADARPFIEETRVVAPGRVGDFELEGSRYDPARKDAGVAFRYRLPAHPEMRIDLFVYPAGLMPEQDAIAAGMTPFLATFEEGVRQKYYDRFELLERTSFEIAPQAVPPTSASKPASKDDALPAQTEAPGDDTDGIASLLSALDPPPIRGERLDLRYRMQMGFDEPVPVRSRGYLFYRQLYYFKGRLTATEAAIGQADFDALTDRAMRELIPAIRAHNIGACAEQRITLGADIVDANPADGALDAAIGRVLAESFTQMDQRNCHRTRADAEAAATADAETVVIVFDPGDWASE